MNKLLKNIKDNDVIVFTNKMEFNYISKYYLNNGYEWVINMLMRIPQFDFEPNKKYVMRINKNFKTMHWCYYGINKHEHIILAKNILREEKLNRINE